MLNLHFLREEAESQWLVGWPLRVRIQHSQLSPVPIQGTQWRQWKSFGRPSAVPSSVMCFAVGEEDSSPLFFLLGKIIWVFLRCYKETWTNFLANPIFVSIKVEWSNVQGNSYMFYSNHWNSHDQHWQILNSEPHLLLPGFTIKFRSFSILLHSRHRPGPAEHMGECSGPQAVI